MKKLINILLTLSIILTVCPIGHVFGDDTVPPQYTIDSFTGTSDDFVPTSDANLSDYTLYKLDGGNTSNSGTYPNCLWFSPENMQLMLKQQTICFSQNNYRSEIINFNETHFYIDIQISSDKQNLNLVLKDKDDTETLFFSANYVKRTCSCEEFKQLGGTIIDSLDADFNLEFELGTKIETITNTLKTKMNASEGVFKKLYVYQFEGSECSPYTLEEFEAGDYWAIALFEAPEGEAYKHTNNETGEYDGLVSKNNAFRIFVTSSVDDPYFSLPDHTYNIDAKHQETDCLAVLWSFDVYDFNDLVGHYTHTKDNCGYCDYYHVENDYEPKEFDVISASKSTIAIKLPNDNSIALQVDEKYSDVFKYDNYALEYDPQLFDLLCRFGEFNEAGDKYSRHQFYKEHIHQYDYDYKLDVTDKIAKMFAYCKCKILNEGVTVKEGSSLNDISVKIHPLDRSKNNDRNKLLLNESDFLERILIDYWKPVEQFIASYLIASYQASFSLLTKVKVENADLDNQEISILKSKIQFGYELSSAIYDINLLMSFDDEDDSYINMEEFSEELQLEINLPSNLIFPNKQYKVLRAHETDEGIEYSMLPAKLENGKLLFSSDKFSTFAVCYEADHHHYKAPNTGVK